jgi:hypothetical protein
MQEMNGLFSLTLGMSGLKEPISNLTEKMAIATCRLPMIA